VPFAVADCVTVTVSVWPKFWSATVTLENGEIGVRSPVVWPATVPLIVGATVPAVAITVVMLLAFRAGPAVSMSVMVKVVVTVPPCAT